MLQGRERLLLDGDPGESRVQLVETAALLKAVLREGSLQEQSGPSIGTEFGVLLPTVNAEPGAGVVATLLFSERFPVGTAHLNVAGGRARDGNAEVFVGMILEGPYEWRVRPVAEAFYDQELGAERILSGLVGLIGRVNERLSLDAGGRVARDADTNVFELRAGLTWAFEVWSSSVLRMPPSS